MGFDIKSMINKSKNRQIGLCQNLEHLCFKGHCQENEKNPTECKKIFANHISDKGLVSE